MMTTSQMPTEGKLLIIFQLLHCDIGFQLGLFLMKSIRNTMMSKILYSVGENLFGIYNKLEMQTEQHLK